MNQSNDKQQIRKIILSLRDQLPGGIKDAHDSAILARLLQMPEYIQAETVLGYMNFGSEFASEHWVAQALKDGKRLVLPRVNRHTNMLDLYYLDDLESQLGSGLWGIREPVVERAKRLNAINEVEFALLPGIAFSKNGARLGYGGGFYDKLLAPAGQSRPVLAVAAYGIQVVEALPQEETDIGVEWIVTESEIIHCRQKINFSESMQDGKYS